MVQLTRAHNELFRRRPDEIFSSMEELHKHCCEERETSKDCWQLPQDLWPHADGDTVSLTLDGEGGVGLNDWSTRPAARQFRQCSAKRDDDSTG